jgi:flagellar hook-length control protein FliK
VETFLLNPNTTAQNPVSQQGVSAIDADSSGDFSPIMDKAATKLENMTEQQDTLSGDSADQTATDLFSDGTDFSGSIDTNASILPDDTIMNSAEALFTIQVPITTETQSNPLQPQPLNLSGTGEEKTAPLFTQPPPSPVNLSGAENEPPPTSKGESLVLQQIQQILDQGKNNGSISITGSNGAVADDQHAKDILQNLSNPLLAESQNGEVQARQVGAAMVTTDDSSVAPQKAAKLESAHQDVTEQFLNAKLGESKKNTDQNFQQNNSEQKGTEQQNKSDVQTTAALTPGSSISEIKPGEAGFSQQFSLSSTTTPQTTTGIEGKMAPGANLLVPERELVDNLIQRFNVNPRLQTSKLTMQLHPAELGALKIDLLVKDDSIKANIVAQSQQVLETLEKHMPRLRTVLQEQGFTVDSFEISMEGDGGNQKELFQEHFSSQQQDFASNGSSTQKNESFDTVLDSQSDSIETDEDTSGVNLTV